jgi:hypothetical protein
MLFRKVKLLGKRGKGGLQIALGVCLTIEPHKTLGEVMKLASFGQARK